MPHKPLGDHPRRELAAIMLALAPVEAQREREGVGEVIRSRSLTKFGALWNSPSA
jgi:hypothetical protein